MLRLVWRALFIAMALVFVASAVVVLLLVTALWALQYLWGHLSGRPVSPMRTYSAGASWSEMMRQADRFAPKPRRAGSAEPEAAADVTDVEVKKISPP